MNQPLVRQIWQRAQHRCEYCRIPYPHYRLPFQVDHVIARQHGGATALDNLAMACFHCNRFKGPNIAGLDPVSGELVRLFVRSPTFGRIISNLTVPNSWA